MFVSSSREREPLRFETLPPAQRSLALADPVLTSLVHDEVVRAEDVPSFLTRLAALEAEQRGPRTVTLDRAPAPTDSPAPMDTPRAGLVPPARVSGADRSRSTGLFASPASVAPGAPPSASGASAEVRLDAAITDATRLEKEGKWAEAAAKWREVAELRESGAGGGSIADRRAAAANYHAHAGACYRRAGDALRAKGDVTGAQAKYREAGDSYAAAVERTPARPSLATGAHWDANAVADWGLAGLEAYRAAGEPIRTEGGARKIGRLDLARVEEGIELSYGVDRGAERGDRWMRYGAVLEGAGDLQGALTAYRKSRDEYRNAIAEDKKFYPEGLAKHTIPEGRARLKIATLEARLSAPPPPPGDYRALLVRAATSREPALTDFVVTGRPPELVGNPPGMARALDLAAALDAKRPPLPAELRGPVRRAAAEAIHDELAWIEAHGTPEQKAAYAVRAAEYLEALGEHAWAREAWAIAAKNEVKLAEAEKRPEVRARLYATAARHLALSEPSTIVEVKALHAKAAQASLAAAAAQPPGTASRAEHLRRAGTELRAAGDEAGAKKAFRDGAAAYLAAAGEVNILASKSPETVTVADLGGSVRNGEEKARKLGQAASMLELSGDPKDRAAAQVLRTRSAALHDLALREKFRDPVFSPPIALDGGKVTPRSIHGYENAILTKFGGNYAAAAEYFDAQATAQVGGGAQEEYFHEAGERMRALQRMKDAGVANLSHPPTRQNLGDYAKARAAYWRTQNDANGHPLSEREVAAHVATELSAVAGPFYAHRGELGHDIDYSPGANNVVTVDGEGRMLGDCEVYAYDVALAMEAAGFDCSTETRASESGGPSHIVVNLKTKSGEPAGTLSNGEYYDSADDAFTSVGLPPGSARRI